jgi:hypothetical protein
MLEEQKIRKRKSYQEFKEFLEVVKTNDVQKIMKHHFSALDRKRAFNSQTSAIYAQEALNLLLKDEKI